MAVETVGLAVAATAAVASPKGRRVIRRGAGYGVAGVRKAGDVVVGSARGAVRGAQEGASSGPKQQEAPEGSSPTTASAGTASPAATT
jgi:hypothetical protein